MARILSDESTLTRKKRYLARESQALSKLWVAEVIGAAGLLAVGGVVYLATGVAGWLVAGGVAAFLALGHFVKIRENQREGRIVAAGLRGESMVTHLLHTRLGNDTYLFNDLRVSQGWRRAQIDHLVVSPRGLFVLETKNWRGEIQGRDADRRWQQIKTPGSRPVSVSNPVLQNRRHVEVLKARLQAAKVDWPDVHSIVVMESPSARWSVPDASVPILTPEGAVGYIAECPASRLHSEAEVDAVINLLMRLR